MTGPALVVVDEDPDALGDVDRELCERYERHYRVICVKSSKDALGCLEELAGADEEVALILAAQRLTEMAGTELP